MQIVPTNMFLHHCHIISSSLCDFCGMNVECLKHLFWECPNVQHFWSNLKRFLTENNIEVCIDFRMISFGSQVKTHTQDVVNFIIILAKYYIFKCKLEKINPIFAAFKRYIQARKNIEKHIAQMKNKLHVFNTKWDQLALDL